MTTTEEIDRYYDQIATPMTDEEFSRHILDPVNCAHDVLELIYAHNKRLCRSVDQWIKYRNFVGEKPSENLLLLLIPGYGGPNDARKNMEELCAFLAKYPHGSVVRWPIIALMLRTSNVLVDKLGVLHSTPHLCDARQHLNTLTDLVSYKGEPLMSRDKFEDSLFTTADNFFHSCELNAIDLHNWLESPSKSPTPEEPLSQRRNLLRQKAVDRMDELYASGMTWSEAEEKAQSEMWREFNKLGLACAKQNFHKLRYR